MISKSAIAILDRSVFIAETIPHRISRLLNNYEDKVSIDDLFDNKALHIRDNRELLERQSSGRSVF